jgi:hypothetical protein
VSDESRKAITSRLKKGERVRILDGALITDWVPPRAASTRLVREDGLGKTLVAAPGPAA